jgi:hypothetical protein
MSFRVLTAKNRPGLWKNNISQQIRNRTSTLCLHNDSLFIKWNSPSMPPQSKKHILPRNLHSANLPNTHHSFLLLRRIISLTPLARSPLRLSRHLTIPKRPELTPILTLTRPLRPLHEPRMHSDVRATWQVDAFRRVDACGRDDFAEHGVVEGRV